MPVAATGIFRAPERMAYLLAASATWQTLTGESTLANAMKHVHVFGVPEDGTTYRVPPRAVVSWQDQDTFREQKIGVGTWVGGGTLTLSIELEVPSYYAVGTTDAHNWFMNQIGAIVANIKANAGIGEPVAGETHLNVISISRIDGPWYMREDEIQILDPANYAQPNVMWVVLAIEYA